MGDSTQAYIEIEGGSDAVRTRIAEAWASFTGDTVEDILAETGEWTEVSCGTVSNAIKQIRPIIDEAPEAERPTFFSLCEDAVYEYPGDLHRYRPSVGWHEASVGNDSEVIIDKAWLYEQIATVPDLATLRENVRAHVGEDWVPQWRVGKLIPEAAPGTRAVYHLRAFFDALSAAQYIETLPDYLSGGYVLDGPAEDS